MTESSVIIRSARSEDCEMIWDILHANCRNWSLRQITDNLSGIFVLVKDLKILGVLAGSSDKSGLIIDWVEIHPLYPEKILRDIMIQSLLGTQTVKLSEKQEFWRVKYA